MTGYDRYCDHAWVREDQLTKQCLKCGQYKGVSDDE